MRSGRFPGRRPGRLSGLSPTRQRHARFVEYTLVILTITIIVVLATWFLGHEIAAGVDRPAAPYAMVAG